MISTPEHAQDLRYFELHLEAQNEHESVMACGEDDFHQQYTRIRTALWKEHDSVISLENVVALDLSRNSACLQGRGSGLWKERDSSRICAPHHNASRGTPGPDMFASQDHEIPKAFTAFTVDITFL